MATLGLVNPIQNPYFHLLDPWTPESRGLLGSPVPLVPSTSFAGHMRHMCTGTQLPQKPHHTGAALHREPWHTPAAPHACALCTQPSHPCSRKLLGLQRAWQMLLGLAPTQAHTHIVGCQLFHAGRGPRHPGSPKAGLGAHQLQLLLPPGQDGSRG